MNLIKKLFSKKEEKQCAIQNVSESAITEVKLKNKGWQKLEDNGSYGEHEGKSGIYYRVVGFGSVHESSCLHFR